MHIEEYLIPAGTNRYLDSNILAFKDLVYFFISPNVLMERTYVTSPPRLVNLNMNSFKAWDCDTISRSFECTRWLRVQCDQMTILIVQLWPFTVIKIYPVA